MHPNKVESIYLNVDKVGVKVGDAVIKGKEIATIKEDEKLILTLIENEKPVRNLNIKDNLILWEN